jgi:hypothetical protein
MRGARVADAQPGDVIAWLKPKFLKSINTGHVAVIVQAPRLRGPYDTAYVLRVADSSRLRHEDDSRGGRGGFGYGTILVEASPSTGAPSGKILGNLWRPPSSNRFMTRIDRVLSLSVLAFLSACSTQPPKAASSGLEVPSPNQILPLVRVRLYASGVGYFERQGSLNAGQHTLPVPKAHLDDALKSLVLLSHGTEQLSLSFPSRISPAVARARAGMPAAENAALSYDRLLAALRGEEVEVKLQSAARLGTSELTGRVVEVVSVEPTHPSYDHGPVGALMAKSDHGTDGDEVKTKEEVARLQLLLLSRERGIIRFDISELVSVRPLDPRIQERFEAALSARMETRGNPTEWLELAGGNRALQDLRIGYLAEVPIWRTSYRLRVEDDGKAELQAWALVHNDTDEAWHGIKLELVDGNPSSFLYPLAAPRYQRRELNTPANELSSVPQLSTATPDKLWGDFSDYQGEVVESISGPDEGHGAGTGEGQGFCSGHGRLGGSHIRRAVAARSAGVVEGASDLIWVGDLAKQAGVLPPAERAVSVYDINAPLQLLPQHSALLPFLKVGVAAKSIVWFSNFASVAERAVGLTNNTQNTLPEGPMAVFGRGGFLGEAILESLQPGARKFARIGSETDFELIATETERDVKRQHVDFYNDSLRTHSVVTLAHRLVFNNRSGIPAEVYVGIGVVPNATVKGNDRLDFDTTTGKPFAIFDVAAGAGKEKHLSSHEGLASSRTLDALEREDLDELIADSSLPEAERAILTRARVVFEQRLAIVRSQEELAEETESTDGDLKRLKESTREIGAKESKEANTVMTNRILTTHDELRKLQLKKRVLEKELADRVKALKAVLSELNAFRPKLLDERRRAEAEAKSQN